jgi:hypothetical protein
MGKPTAPDPSEYSAWLTTSQAAAALGVAERTVQRRCKAGKLTARQVTTGDGLEWRIDPATVPTLATGGDTLPPQVPTPIHAQNDGATVQSGGSVPTGGAKVATGAAIGGDSALLTQLQSENLFLRGLVEQRDRDAAELRAALRKALDAMPKAIEAGSTQSTLETSREVAPGRAESTQAVKNAPAASSDKQRQPETRGDALQRIRDGLRVLLGFKQ